MRLTVIQTEDDHYWCLYSWDTSHIDKQWIKEMLKIDVGEMVAYELKEWTLKQVEQILKWLLELWKH